MKRNVSYIVCALVFLGLLAAVLLPSGSGCGTSYIKIHTIERGSFIGTSGLSTGAWLGHDVHEAELVRIVEKYRDRNEGWHFPNPFEPSPYRVGAVIELLIQIRNSEIKGLCLELLLDPEIGDRAPGYLADIGDLDASPAIVKAMHESEGSGHTYLSALQQLKDRRAIPFWIEKFDDDYAQVGSAKFWFKSIEALSGEDLQQYFPKRWNARSSPKQVHTALQAWWQVYSKENEIEEFQY